MLLFQVLLLASLEYDMLWVWVFLFKINLARILLLIQIDVKYAATIIKYSKAQNAKISSIIHITLEAART